MNIFLRIRTGFGCLEKTSQLIDGECEQYTHKYSTYRVAQHDHISSREHAWLKIKDCTSLCPWNTSTCHVSFLAAPDTDHKHKFSLIHFIHFSYLSDSLTSTNKPYDSQPKNTLRCSTAEWRINTIASFTMFFTGVNPMFIDHYRENDYDVTIAAHKNIRKYIKIQYLGVIWGLLRVKDCSSIRPRSNAIILYNTLLAMCNENVVIMESGEELYSKTDQSPSAPQKVVLKPNFNYEGQDTTSSDARKSFDHSDKHGGTYRETCRGEMDFRIQGLHHSAFQEHDHIRKQAVQKFIHQFENHPNKEALQEDLQQKRAFNPFSEKAKEVIYSMGNVEYFEMLRDHSPKYNAPTVWHPGRKVLYTAHAEHAYDLQTKFENSTVTATMFYQYPITSWKGTVPWETPREHGKTENLPSSPCLFHQSKEEWVFINTG